MSDMCRPRVLYILGAGHCGSTLLNLALNQHRQIVGVSEIVHLNRFGKGQPGNGNVLEDPFWKSVSDAYRSKYSESFWDVPFNAQAIGKSVSAEEWEKRNFRALQSIVRVTEKPVVADSSKDPRRLEALLRIPGLQLRVIYLVRDARAVIHSYERKYGNWRHGARKLARLDRLARNIKKNVRASSWMNLRYEDLATDFEGSLRGVCTYAEVSFDPAMLVPDTENYNGIGGNRMRREPVRMIECDDAWLHDMPEWKQTLTNIVFHRYNSSNGYR